MYVAAPTILSDLSCPLWSMAPRASPRPLSTADCKTVQAQASWSATPAKLSTLVEREETPEHGIQTSLNSLTSPTPTSNTHSKTPQRAHGIAVGTENMHPALFQDTEKKLASEQRFGFGAKSTTSTPTKQPLAVSTPRTVPVKAADNPFSSPSFEFRFKRPSSDLSSEAQKLMDEVREQAARIKSELAAQREQQLQEDGDTEMTYGVNGRRIAKAKGKAGRFSDVHLQEFKKMDSIANHPSSFRVDTSRLPAAATSLKRTNSKAGLDKPDSTSQKATKPADSEPAESPSKRVKQQHTSAGSRPTSRSGPSAIPALAVPRFAKCNQTPADGGASDALPNGTPIKIGLPRPASSNNLVDKDSKIPSIPRTPSTKSLVNPRTNGTSIPQTDPSNKHRFGFANKLSNVKSILRKPQIRFSNDPMKQAAGTHISVPASTQAPGSPCLNKVLPAVPQSEPGTPSRRPEKHVNFSPTPGVLGPTPPMSANTPSPMKKQPGLLPMSKVPLNYPSLPAIGASGPPRAIISPRKVRASVAGPGDFTFRADRNISFAQSPQKPSTSTIRKVRASDASTFNTQMGGQLPDLQSVPHGLTNKKRKRESDEQVSLTEDKENQNQEHPQESPSKRAKTVPSTSASPVKMPPSIRRPESSPKRKGFLSLSRLQALAKPKDRK